MPAIKVRRIEVRKVEMGNWRDRRWEVKIIASDGSTAHSETIERDTIDDTIAYAESKAIDLSGTVGLPVGRWSRRSAGSEGTWYPERKPAVGSVDPSEAVTQHDGDGEE